MSAASRQRALACYRPEVVVWQHEALWKHLIEVAKDEDTKPLCSPRFDEPAFFSPGHIGNRTIYRRKSRYSMRSMEGAAW
jgi:hypothetical protein